MSNKGKVFIVSAVLAMVLSGCGGGGIDPSDFDYSPSDPSQASAQDTLKIKKIEGNSFNLHWIKKSSGYAEVTYRRKGSNERGVRIVTDNGPTEVDMDCYVQTYTDTQARYKCINKLDSAEVNAVAYIDVPSDNDIEILMNETISLVAQPVTKTLHYDPQTQNVTFY